MVAGGFESMSNTPYYLNRKAIVNKVSLTIVGTNIKKQQIRRSDLLKVKVGF